MGVTTIEWAHYTFNPWRGCEKISPGCKHCYAATMDARWGNDNWGRDKPRPIASESYWRQPLKWNDAAVRAGVRKRVFCASMADVFEDRADLVEARQRLFRLILATPQLDWMLLTKRPENFPKLLPWDARTGTPWPNVMLGTTAEDREHAARRTKLLLRTRAARRFLSVEPMLEDVSDVLEPLLVQEGERPDGATGYECQKCGARRAIPRSRVERTTCVCGADPGYWSGSMATIDWVICGAESGHHARPMREDWVRALRDECQAAGVKFFLKQIVVKGRKVSLPLFDGVRHDATP